MSNLEQPRPARNLTDEEVAQIEVGHTAIAPATARVLLGCFLAAIVLVPIVEWTGRRTLGQAGVATPWSHLSTLRDELRSRLAAAPTADAGWWSVAVSANHTAILRLSEFERALESESLIARSLRPPAQAVVTGWLGAGNERVYLGRDGWLFYRSDVEYLTGPGFLEPPELDRRVGAASGSPSPRQPDPRAAIVRFARDLDARGITLVVMPTPTKPGVHPEMLAGRYRDATEVLHNPSYRAFIEELRRDGVRVFDPSDALAAARRSGPQYLATDTHWRPETMEGIAELLGGFITTHANLPAAGDPGYRVERVEVRNTGDLARMLDLPADATLFPPEAVWLRRVLQPDGSPWRSSRGADVLVLGDSFTNIYALESLGWGTSSGLAEQVSYTLGRPVDRLVQNDEGAFATRAMLQRDPSRLNGTRVVIYQFAARELTFGDWKVLPLPTQ
jgi:alginate O-acetyltransferase complex protein AlgJ